MKFDFVTNGYGQQLHSINNRQWHFNIFGCGNMIFTKLEIPTRGDSLNTNGIKIGSSIAEMG